MITKLVATIRAVAGEDLARRLAGGAVVALLIKTASAGLTFLMFVALARAMPAVEFGWFASGFSLALFLAIAATLGQPKLLLRFLSTYRGGGDAGEARAVARFSFRRLITASLLLTAGCLATAGVRYASGAANDAALWLGIGLLIIPYALSDYYSHGLRALGRVPMALAPRDIVWRGAIMLAAGGAIFSASRPGAAEVLVLCALLLALAIAAQWHSFRRLLKRESPGPPPGSARSQWKRATPGLAMLGIMGEAFPHAFVVVTGLALSTLDAGPFFAAMKTALLLSLPLEATNMITAPMIARHSRQDDSTALQHTCRTAVALTTPVTLAGMLLLIFLGRPILSLFDPGFEVAYAALLIMAAGRLLNALCGPTALLMTMTGHERRFLAYLSGSNLAGLAVLVALTPGFGLAGAAAGVLVAQGAWNLAVWQWARRHMGVDPTILGLWPRLRPTPPPAG